MPKTLLNIWAQPGAKKNMVVGEMDGAIKIKVAAPPVDGKANKELVTFIAKKLGLKKNAVTIESGEKSRRKTISIEGMEADDARRKLLSN